MTCRGSPVCGHQACSQPSADIDLRLGRGNLGQMEPAAALTTMRLILQGEGVKPTGEWFGFYAARQVRVPTEQDAASEALKILEADWQGPSRHLGELKQCQVLAAWRKPFTAWRKLPNAGHTFYNDDSDAQKAALRLEAKAASAPADALRAWLDDLGGHGDTVGAALTNVRRRASSWSSD